MRASDLGLSARDVARIKAQAERVAATGELPAALDDLDAPWRVGAVPAGWVTRYSGQRVGSWAGAALLAWPKT